MIKEAFRDIFGGSGGPNQNAIPVYSDHNAPFGGQALGPNGLQLMLANSDVSGVHYVVVEPSLLTPSENEGGRYMTFKSNGEVNYIKIWVKDDGGHGVEIQPGKEAWVEYSHLKPISAPEPPVPTPTGKQYKVELTVTGIITEI